MSDEIPITNKQIIPPQKKQIGEEDLGKTQIKKKASPKKKTYSQRLARWGVNQLKEITYTEGSPAHELFEIEKAINEDLEMALRQLKNYIKIKIEWNYLQNPPSKSVFKELQNTIDQYLESFKKLKVLEIDNENITEEHYTKELINDNDDSAKKILKELVKKKNMWLRQSIPGLMRTKKIKQKAAEIAIDYLQKNIDLYCETLGTTEKAIIREIKNAL